MIDTLNADVSTFQRSNVSTPTISDHAAPRFDPAATAFGAGVESADRLVPEETSGQVTLGARASGPIESLVPATPANHVRPLRDVSPDYNEAQSRLLKLRARQALLDQGHSTKFAARELGEAHVTLWRWAQRVAGLDLEDPKNLPDILDKLCDRTSACGRSGDYEPLLLIPAVGQKLREIHAATLGASAASMTNDRRTGNYSATLKAFTLEPECPEPLKPKLLAGKFPVCLTRFLAQVTPEIEARLRGTKHFALHGPSGRREKCIGLPDGSRAYLPAGWVIELDDMSVNQPFWVEGPDGPILSRQGLYVRCLKGGWRAVELISRPRESYTSADILRFLRRFCSLYGKPRKVRIERSVWAARNIAGFRLQGGDWVQEEVVRDAMGKEQRSDLENGLRAIGVEIEYCHSARGKSDLEGAFHPFQTNLAIFTRDFINVGRHAGEFEHAARKMRQVRAGSHHPKDLGFPHQSELLARIQKTFDFLNSLPRKGGTFDEVWTRDTAKWPLAALTTGDLAAFLPLLRERAINGGAVYPVVNGKTFCFRAPEAFMSLGDGYRVYVRFDDTEPSLGAAIYNREGNNSSNHQGHALGKFIAWAAHDVPGCTTYADTVPDDLPRYSVEELHGPGAVANQAAGLKQQRQAVNGFVRAAFSGGKPGQPAARTIEARTAAGVAKLATGTPLIEPALPAQSPEPRAQSLIRPSTPEEFSKASDRRRRQGAAARALLEASA